MPDTDVYSPTGRAPGAYPIGSESQAPTLSSFVLRGGRAGQQVRKVGGLQIVVKVSPWMKLTEGIGNGCLATAPSRKVSGGWCSCSSSLPIANRCVAYALDEVA
ncbi:unnamed protein product [Acanthoscelides obtectus]|uniref:Uncharacterized protein n=1 Tax=Acanthoscelides obtectus TaxID=200917 RepID=A0A9P0VTX5_ACAOB|nr:unnamed protein product [Acanthoscelides obtectus]CAK1689506.1 hypothetical protein AOBTE_LOCUS37311 [Acanthoscelides obtectus]